MTYHEILHQLEILGTERNRKIYMRHGSGQNTFGVSFANLRKIAKGIGRDHDVACALWASENVDARALALMVADPQRLNLKFIESWLKSVTYSLLVGMIADVVANTSFAKTALHKWTAAKNDHVKAAGFSLLSNLVKNGAPFEDDELLLFIDAIKRQIHNSPNQSRYAMNGALIAIGIYRRELTKCAIDAAKEIGKVEVDHGDTACKTPDAVAYIKKALARRQK